MECFILIYCLVVYSKIFKAHFLIFLLYPKIFNQNNDNNIYIYICGIHNVFYAIQT